MRKECTEATQLTRGTVGVQGTYTKYKMATCVLFTVKKSMMQMLHTRHLLFLTRPICYLVTGNMFIAYSTAL